MSQRIKGQEGAVVIIFAQTQQTALMTVKSWDFTYKLETLVEGYTGETTDRVDSIYHGVEGNIELHLESPAAFASVEAMIQKARRRVPGISANLRFRLAFPNGRVALIIVPGVEFGEIPVAAGSRSDYISMKLKFVASDATSVGAV